ncbi:ABC-2 transporter permease [Tissierellaceae bacterium HCP3S3_D8]
MKSLIMKDIKLAGFLVKFLIVLFGTLTTLIISAMDNIYYTFWGYLASVIFSMGLVYWVINNLDQHTEADIILNSIPVEKEVIVKARYVAIMIYILAISFMVPILSILIKNEISMPNGIPITIGLSFYMIGITTFIYSIYIPMDFYHRGNIEKIRGSMFKEVWILIITAVFSMRQNNIIYRSIKAIDINSFPVLLTIFSILSYLISLHISIKIYREKEF